MFSAITVAQAFLDLATKENLCLTNMQLQKLVFFAHGVHLAVNDGQPLIDESVRAWQFGPVIPSLYEKLRRFGNNVVNPNLAPETRDSFDPDNSRAGRAIRAVWKAYKGWEGWELSAITHNPNTPWDIVWNQNKNHFGDISDYEIRRYYQTRVKQKNDTK